MACCNAKLATRGCWLTGSREFLFETLNIKSDLNDGDDNWLFFFSVCIFAFLSAADKNLASPLHPSYVVERYGSAQSVGGSWSGGAGEIDAPLLFPSTSPPLINI